MADLPTCPDCHRRDFQRLLGENDNHWMFGCLRCVTRWIVSKPHTRAKAAYDHEAKRFRQASEFERARLARPKYFT